MPSTNRITREKVIDSNVEFPDRPWFNYGINISGFNRSSFPSYKPEEDKIGEYYLAVLEYYEHELFKREQDVRRHKRYETNYRKKYKNIINKGD